METISGPPPHAMPVRMKHSESWVGQDILLGNPAKITRMYRGDTVFPPFSRFRIIGTVGRKKFQLINSDDDYRMTICADVQWLNDHGVYIETFKGSAP